MKNDLATAIISAIVGLVFAILFTNVLKGEIEPFDVKTISDSVNIELAEPDPEIFNYRALNPTVEVYIGACADYDEHGECLEDLAEWNSGEQEGSGEIEWPGELTPSEEQGY